MITRHLDKYVAVQAVIIAALLLSTPYARIDLPKSVVVLGFVSLVSGICIMVIALRKLGAALTPAVSPLQEGTLITSGIYSIVRHPVYFGVTVSAIGWSVMWGSFLAFAISILLFIFFAFKSHQEEILLAKKYPEYARYKMQVSKKILPYIY